MSHDATDVKKHVRSYIAVFVLLAGLTVLTVKVSTLHLPVVQAIIVALIIATVKGSLVACYFMHLISEKKLIFLVLIFTFIFFTFLLFLPVATHLDMSNSSKVGHVS